MNSRWVNENQPDGGWGPGFSFQKNGGNEEGLYRLWRTVGEAMVSKKGRARVRLDRGPQKDYFILRLENGAHFFRILR